MKAATRVIGALRLDSRVFLEVRQDPAALHQAATVVLIAGCALALGTHGAEEPSTLAVSMASAVLAWVFTSWVAYTIGTTLARDSTATPAQWIHVLRCTGYAAAPAMVAFAGAVRPFAGVAVFIAAGWTLIAFVVAIRIGLGYRGVVRAMLVAAVAWSVNGLVISILTPPA